MKENSRTFLCLASFEKGFDFLIECKNQGNRVLLVTSDSLKNVNWPKDYIDEIFYMPDNNNEWNIDDLVKSVSFLARTEDIYRIIALDDFDVEKAAKLREHLRIPGMGDTTARYFRDKLAMRIKAEDDGLPIPNFVHVLNHNRINAFLENNKPPYILKPRSQAGAIGLKKCESSDEAWDAINKLGDEQSLYLIEEFIEGNIYHVDSIIIDRKIKFAQVHEYALPPFEVAHKGRVFCSRTVNKGSIEEKGLKQLNQKVIKSLGLKKGVSHTEFIKDKEGKFYFLETSARVGGANLSNLIEESTGINMWKEWAVIENLNDGEEYALPKQKNLFGAIIISLAKQEWPDLNNYNNDEVVWKLNKKFHAGLVLVSKEYKKMKELSDSFIERFYKDFFTTQPIKDKVSS
ncbi:MAG: ATP-grasp domain-containing protein [Ignavibacteriales bacterium]|nr:ATP-grasp domain-containing protein [Ignavibacteriales bacterium]MCB9219537.1 ATP-grasp domain-containing protein [Ignavibacteriales bacterium]MCB9257861.1 ATP-grasp domain-containing protein [Ignavibacteriales bacterium]